MSKYLALKIGIFSAATVASWCIVNTSAQAAMVGNISHSTAARLCSKHGGLTSDQSGATEGCSYKRGNKDYDVACVSGKCTVVSVIKLKGGSIGAGRKLPVGTVKPISGGYGNVGTGKPIRHPIQVGITNPPNNDKSDPVTWKHGGMNQGGGHRR